MPKRVSVAEGKKEFIRLLKEAKEKGTPILVFNARREELVAAILPPQEYARYAGMRAYFEALRLSKKFANRELDASELVQKARKELEERLG